MKINRHNYEAFLLDRLEGSLSPEELQELEQFLVLNPDCCSELSALELRVLKGEKLPYPGKALLKKDFPDHSAILEDHNFDIFSIARMEGDLAEEQIRAHQAIVEEDEGKALQWQHWQRTRLEAGPLIYQGKENLKRRKTHKGRMVLMQVMAAAAVLALLIILLRTEPELPQPSSRMPVQERELIPEVEPVPDRGPVAQADRTTGPGEQGAEHPDALKPDPSEEPPAITELETLQAVRPESFAISANRFSKYSMVAEVDPDRIKPLQIDPLPVHLSSLSLAQISDIGLQEVVEEYAGEKDFSLWKIADSGIRGINRITGSEISLLASRDEDGEVSGFQLKSKRFSLTRPLNRED